MGRHIYEVGEGWTAGGVGGEGDEVGWEVFAAGGLGMDQSPPPLR